MQRLLQYTVDVVHRCALNPVQSIFVIRICDVLWAIGLGHSSVAAAIDRLIRKAQSIKVCRDDLDV